MTAGTEVKSISPTRRIFPQLRRGVVIPAHPLALTAGRRLDERRQRALTRYYLSAGAGGIAVGVHTTQFRIRDPKVGLLHPVLALAAQTVAEWEAPDRRGRPPPVIRIAGICGPTRQAVREAALAADLGYHIGLLSLGGLTRASNARLIAHAREVGRVVPLMGFYLQPAAGGRELDAAFWRRFVEIERVVAIKIAPFDQYRTLDVIRAIVESGRRDIALYTGNDDSILVDLLTRYVVAGEQGGRGVRRVRPVRLVGGLLGQWAVWTRRAVEQLERCHRIARRPGRSIPPSLLTLAAQITDANAAIFDSAHGFAGCIPGIHEILRRQGLLIGRWCLDPNEELSSGQMAQIDRVCRAYPHLNDDEFVHRHRDDWMR